MLAQSLNTTRVHGTSSATISKWNDFLDRATSEISAYGPRRQDFMGALSRVSLVADRDAKGLESLLVKHLPC